MKPYIWLTGFFLLCSFVSQAVAQTVPAPKGWVEAVTGSSRLISKSTTQIEIFNWQDLRGQTIESYLKQIETIVPAGAVFISSEAIKPADSKIPGAFSISRKVEWNGKAGVSMLIGCPGQPGHARIISLNDSNGRLGGLGRIVTGGRFIQKVCKQKQTPDQMVSNPVVSSGEINSSTTALSGGDLANENARIPKENHPDQAYVITKLETQGIGISMMVVPVPHMMMTFPNGYSTYCKKWNLVTQTPTPDSIGDNCKLTQESIKDSPRYSSGPGPKPALLHPFKPGETLDFSLGRLSGVGYDLGTAGQSNIISKGELTLKKNGRIIIGNSVLSSIVPNADVAAYGNSKKSHGGRYYLNGYTITIETDVGDISHSFIGSFHKDKVTSVMFRDKFYSARLKDK